MSDISINVGRPLNAQLWERAVNDFYAEPRGVADAVARYLAPEIGDGFVLDPFCGTGRIVGALNRADAWPIGVDLVPRWHSNPRAQQYIDHFAEGDGFAWMRNARRHVAVVSNPPYDRKILWPALAAAKECAPLVAFILPAAFWQSKSAIPHCDGLAEVLAITPRPSMPPGVYDEEATHTPDGAPIGGGKQDYVLAIWRRGHVGSFKGGWLYWQRNAPSKTDALP